MTLVDEALAWHAAGYTPVPIVTNGQKRPIGAWKHLQSGRPTSEQVVRAFDTDTDGIGLVCGATSGNLEMFEAEGRAVTEGLVSRLAGLFHDHALDELWQRLNSGYVELTPSGGLHWYYRVDGPVAGNTKLARRPATEAELAEMPDDRIKVLLETRGEGGFTVVAPSAGRTHVSGKPWITVAGGRDTIPLLTVDERDALHMLANMLDETPETVVDHVATRPRQEGDPLRPGDDFNTRATWDDILTPHGWQKARKFGGNCWGWVRPGKKAADGISATTGRNDGDNLYVFSSSTIFDTEKPYSKFAAHAVLNHNGDYSAAAKALRGDGYGDTTPISPEGGNGLSGLIDPATPINGSLALVADIDAGHVPDPDATITDVTKVALAYGPTEDGTARALVRLHGDTLRYCPERGQWLSWDGSRWRWDRSEHHRELIREIARPIPEEDKWKTYKKRALSSSGVTGIARLAQSDQRVLVHIDQLDARPYELNTPGGIVNLRTGKLTPANPAALHTRTTTVTPDFSGPPDKWVDFLDSTFGGDDDLIAYIRRLLGLALIGNVLEQILPFAHGSGANGKSTLSETVLSILGRGEDGYAVTVQSELLMMRRFTGHPAEVAQLAGARLVVCSEIEDGEKFAEARIKQFTGRDSINARFMRQDPFTFVPSWLFWLNGNHKPSVTAGGPAFWRRVQMIPFDHVVPEGERDPHLGSKLEAEADRILAWIIGGAVDYLKAGLRIPAIVRNATLEYAREEDSVGQFVDERCHLANSTQVQIKTSELRSAYEAWCTEAGEEPVSAKKLTAELQGRHGVSSTRSNGRRFYLGITLVSDDEDDADKGKWWDK